VKSVALLVLLGATAAVAEPQAKEQAQRVFDAPTGLAPGWEDLGWAKHEIASGAPVRIDFSGQAGWILSKPDLSGSFVALTFRARVPPSLGEFLEVHLDAQRGGHFPRVRVRIPPAAANGMSEVSVSMADLNPRGALFNRIVFQAFREVGHDEVLLDAIALVPGIPVRPPPPTRAVRVSLECGATARPISPLIYGVAHGDPSWWETGTPVRRWGGNPNTRYNWENGHAWNAGNDWFFRNVNYGNQQGAAWETFLEENAAHGVRSALTVPMIGWVAKDTESYSFPVSALGPQLKVDPQNPDVGDGMTPDGGMVPPLSPSRTSVAAPPAFIARWLSAIREREKSGEKSGFRSVDQYILDNEPTAWNTTHRDVHPDPVGYDELLDRTIRYGTALRLADPSATIAGFVGWGWTSYFFSARDAQPSYGAHLDRLAHGDQPLLPWWLRSVRDYEKKEGIHLVDIVDVHYYPQGDNIGIGTGGNIDSATAARRIRATRSLWDPRYVDESWIHEPVRLIPRMQAWVRENAPGMGISIGEWNFGAEGHMSGGLAAAEALGRFGQGGLTSAFYWTAPPKSSPAFWAFRAYRNFDGKGGRFLDFSVPAKSSDGLTSVFASRDASGTQMVLVLLQLDPTMGATATIDAGACGTVTSRRGFEYIGDGGGFFSVPPLLPPAQGGLQERLPPYSIMVLDLKLDPTRR